jgi:chromate transporter
MKKIWTLFFSCLYISACTFGGGFVIVTFFKQKFVNQLHWIDEEEMLDLIALAQCSPGAIAVNGAILIGLKIAGVAGMTAAVIGSLIPPMVILSIITFFYQAFASNIYFAAMLGGMQAGVVAVLIHVIYGLCVTLFQKKRPVLLVIMLLSFLANTVFKINIMLILLAAILAGALASMRKKEEC